MGKTSEQAATVAVLGALVVQADQAKEYVGSVVMVEHLVAMWELAEVVAVMVEVVMGVAVPRSTHCNQRIRRMWSTLPPRNGCD